MQPREVEGAIRARGYESDVKTTDALLDSIEARTRAVEKLLEKTKTPSWDATITQQDQQNPGAAQIKTEENSEKLSEQGETAPIQVRTELPQPTYALSGGAHMRSGLTAVADVLNKATVLLQMQPGKKGIRRFKKTADPVLCGRRNCYMSSGFSESAKHMHRGAILGPFNTLGRRAGACRQKLMCAYRNIDLMEQGVLMQPVDLKIVHHDRRAYRKVTVDQSCRAQAGRLHCSNPIVAKTWKAWVVPEHIAIEAGADALQAALQDGLPDAPIPVVTVQPVR